MEANQEAIVLSAASLKAQISDWRRARNDHPPELVGLFDELDARLDRLVDLLPSAGEPVSASQAQKIHDWLRDFRGSLNKAAAGYLSPQNLGEATLPAGIILGCTALGVLFGAPLAGSVVGTAITSHLKWGSAIDKLLKPSGGDSDY